MPSCCLASWYLAAKPETLFLLPDSLLHCWCSPPHQRRPNVCVQDLKSRVCKNFNQTLLTDAKWRPNEGLRNKMLQEFKQGRDVSSAQELFLDCIALGFVTHVLDQGWPNFWCKFHNLAWEGNDNRMLETFHLFISINKSTGTTLGLCV